MVCFDPFCLELTEEQKKQLYDCGRNMVPIHEIPFVLNCDEFSFRETVRQTGSEVRNIYMKGLAETSCKIREIARELAEAGSPTAITEVMSSYNSCLQAMD